MFNFSWLAAAQILLLVASIIWLLRRNDEVPALISGVLFYCSTYRVWSVTKGFDDWVRIWQNVLSPITEEKALEVMGYIVLGQAILIGTYMYRQKYVLNISNPKEAPALLNWLRPRVIMLSLSGIPLAIVMRYIATVQQRTNLSALDTSGYLLLFPLALIGLSILNISLWKVGGYPSLDYKVLAAIILVGIAYLTFGPSLRFQFVGWIVGAGIIIAGNYARKRRVIIFGIVSVLCLSMFAFAGSLRNEMGTADSNPAGASFASSGDVNSAWERFASASDANMVDGFVLLEEVYPKMLDYTWGGDHLEILLRPIPRSLWVDKPVGGFANRLGFTDYDIGITGIAPSLFGSFYAEGGIIGIVILSIIYGAGLAAIVGHTVHLRPFASLTIRAVVCASLVPMLRGGDLAGIYAWIGMAYWPCFLLLWLKRKSLRASLTPAVKQDGSGPLRTLYASFRTGGRHRRRLGN